MTSASTEGLTYRRKMFLKESRPETALKSASWIPWSTLAIERTVPSVPTASPIRHRFRIHVP
jgi:hypothetical protein